MNLRSPKFSLREFSESVKHLDSLEILDAVLQELHAISMNCRELGFGNMPKKGSKARRYFDDLSVLVPLYTHTNLPNFREGYVEEANAMLRKMSHNLLSLQHLSLP